ncbi:hypothetical protein AOQ84DRAFT_291683 [Glonium stellatum]|uniref:Orc1-like AAA ATPase domain-containing protein n=1 Tax=Glonium stellatum TaxID=574774 RepID=A0A8E2JTS8_9PEZI|nr:hypothetical protein AOQ84DRAFT_291683 [Glonium stellatum]
MLPEEVLLGTLNEQYPCRELQIRQLFALYSPYLPSPPAIVVHGLEATGKSSIVKSVLDTSKVPHAIINSRECITGRHLLERTVTSCLDAIDESSEDKVDRRPYSRCENISALAIHLQRLLDGRERFVLVFDGIDRQREAPPTLLPALARFGEIIPNLSIIFIISVPRPRFLHATGVPFINFPAYTKDESIQILSKSPPQIFLEPPEDSPEYTEEQAEEDNAWVWTRFLTAVWDALAKGAARDILSFRAVADKIWRPFVAPIVDGTFGTRDFSRLMVAKRALFQSEDVLLERVVPRTEETTTSAVSKGNYCFLSQFTHDLPYYSKYLLCAAYLASYNPARQDSIYFMKASERKRRKKGGGTAAGRAGRGAKHRKIPRNLLAPSPFPLDRLLAIFHAIVPHSITPTADIYTQITTLSSIRLLVRAGPAGSDVLDPGCKWRVNFGWDYVATLGRSVGFEIAEYLAGGAE